LQYAWIKIACRLAAEGSAGAGAWATTTKAFTPFAARSVGNMADFVREFEVRHQIKLEQNYRSHSHILDTANELIKPQQNPLGQKPAHRPRAPASQCVSWSPPGDLAEAQWMVDEIKQLLRDGRDGDGSKAWPRAAKWRCCTAATRKAG
jgi:DNA helicase-2/ATP-dependent DNA helicase PcrA